MSKERSGMSCKEAAILGGLKTKERYKKLKQEKIEEYNKNPKLCKRCGSPIEYDKRNGNFCSRSCAVSYGNLHRKPMSEKTKKRISNGMSAYYAPIKKTKYCKICGAVKGQCKDSNVCKKFQLIKNLEKFGFDKSVIGTEKVINEFYRVKNLIKNFYELNSSNNDALIKCFNYHSGSANFMKILKSLEIESKTHSDACIEAWLSGRLREYETNNQYHSTWHTTWDNKEVYLRSSYELEYAQELDNKQIQYEVESLRIKYFDTKENTYRCAIPDFYLPDTNTIIEIKSFFILNTYFLNINTLLNI